MQITHREVKEIIQGRANRKYFRYLVIFMAAFLLSALGLEKLLGPASTVEQIAFAAPFFVILLGFVIWWLRATNRAARPQLAEFEKNPTVDLVPTLEYHRKVEQA